jgi:ubiquinone/menaquinone biosynthesis C-methylase UbiE
MNSLEHMRKVASGSRDDLKRRVREHWAAEPCGTREVSVDDRKTFFAKVEAERYAGEPEIPKFARWERGRGKRVLEIGVGAGTDFVNWARHGAVLSGIDLTQQGVDLAGERLALEGLSADLRVADAENLPFEDDSFDIAYSYGVLHHSPDTEKTISEVHRVLKPGGTALIMLYNLRSWTAWNVWAIQCLAKLRPWKSPRWAVFHHLESPGTKAYTEEETRDLFAAFASATMRTSFLPGDMLSMSRSEKYRGALARFVFSVYPRPLVRWLGPRFGFARLIEATK